MDARDCEYTKGLLSPYLEGELAPAEREAVEGHLADCPDCRFDLALLRRTVSALRALPELPPPAGILQAVREALHPQPWYRRLLGAAPGAAPRRLPFGALATLLVAFGVFVLTDRYPDLGGEPAGIPAPPLSGESVKDEVRQPPPPPPTAPAVLSEGLEEKKAEGAAPPRVALPPPPAGRTGSPRASGEAGRPGARRREGPRRKEQPPSRRLRSRRRRRHRSGGRSPERSRGGPGLRGGGGAGDGRQGSHEHRGGSPGRSRPGAGGRRRSPSQRRFPPWGSLEQVPSRPCGG